MAGAIADYPQNSEGAVVVPAPVAPPEKEVSPPGVDPLDVDTSLTGDGSAVNSELSGGPNPALSPVIYFPTVTQTQFDALNLPASGIRLSQAGAKTAVKAGGIRSSIVAYAKQFLGVPYVWGGTTPRGFDCSGFVQYVLRANGKAVPRVSQQQARTGKVVAISNLQVGDLVAWNNNNVPGADHIAIYIGNGQIIEAPHTGATVRIRKLGTHGFDSRAFGVHITYPGE